MKLPRKMMKSIFSVEVVIDLKEPKKILEEAGYQKVFNIGGFKEASDYIREKAKVLKIDAT